MLKFILVLLFLHLEAISSARFKCSNCTSNPPIKRAGSYMRDEMGPDGCYCPHELLVCPRHYDLCKKDESCVLEDIKCTFENCKLKTAKCRSFNRCRGLKDCNTQCKGGYRKDINGCSACYCADKCQELCGEKDCDVSGVAGEDPVIRCNDKPKVPTEPPKEVTRHPMRPSVIAKKENRTLPSTSEKNSMRQKRKLSQKQD